jgi:hypothetical protein
MKYYKNKETNEVFAFELDGSQDYLITKDFVAMEECEVYKHLNPEQSVESLIAIERYWRDSELTRADIELNKAQDGDGTGSVRAWREYRKSLRVYPEVEGFPVSGLRPKAPDAQQ